MISKHYISWIYTILTESAEPRIPPFIERWGKELGIRKKEQQLNNVLGSVHSLAVDIDTTEIKEIY